jgi:hypothetical protein
MKKITKLTKEQEADLPIWRDRYLAYGLSTEPADRPKAEESVDLAYEIAGLKPPTQKFWLDSPLAGARGAAHLAAHGKLPRGDLSKGVTKRQVEEALSQACFGMHDASWVGFYSFFAHHFDIATEIRGLDGITQSCGWWWAFDEAAILTERPNFLTRDSEGRLHNESRSAISYPDGFGVYAWHGIRVPERIITDPKSITVKEIENEPNVEVRRIMTERYGLDKFVKDSGAVELGRDEYGILWRKEQPGDQDLLMVEVVNGSPEPDGTFNHYFLDVSGASARLGWPIRTAHDAVAATYGLRASEYQPLLRT